ncbi:MAG: large conductance mechanosensitive channel protein MscL [Acidobacteriota bacterium]|nr:large conductance mechanosensitive channel protein MscL [Acidobacteriota bacterium]
MFQEFRTFLLKQNALALAIGVIIGAAVSKVVSSLADNVISPIVGLVLPGGSWRDAVIHMRSTVDPKTGKIVEANIGYGQLLGAVIDFLIIGFVVFLIARALLPKLSEAPKTKNCPQCGEVIPLAATRCRACTQPVA